MIKDIDLSTIEPVSLQSVKAFLRVDHEHEDELIAGLIQSARERIETYLSISLIMRRRLYTKANPTNASLYINHHPIKRVIAVDCVFDGDSADGLERSQRLAPSDYLINLHARPASLRLLTARSLSAKAIQIEIEAGFGPEGSDVPMPIRQAIMLLIAHNYEHRGAAETAMPMMVDALLMPYRGLRL